MALDKRFLDPTGSASKGTRALGIYQSTTDNRAAINGAGYFNGAAAELERVGVLLIFATDKTYFAKVAIAAGVVTISLLDQHTDPT